MRALRDAAVLTGFAGALSLACGSPGGSEPPDAGGPIGDADEVDGLVSIVVEPQDETFVIEGDDPARADYQAIGQLEDGGEVDLTDQAQFSLDNQGVGSFEGASFTSSIARGGRSGVSATVGSTTGTTSLSVTIRQEHTDPDSADDLPDDPGGHFGGDENSDRAPELVYPNDGVLVPPNLEELEFHFFPGDDNDLFELTFANEFTDVTVYLTCTQELNGGCIYEPDSTLWTWLSQTNRGGDSVEVGLRATSEDSEEVGVSDTIDFSLSFDNVRGAIYYWTTSGDSAIMTYDFGGNQEQAEVVLEPADVGEQGGVSEPDCVGCHALSPDGTKMVSELDGQWDGRLVLYDIVEDEIPLPVTDENQSIFQSWSPDSNQFVGVYMDTGSDEFNLRLFDGDTMERTGTIDVGADDEQPANHPDWSPDGDEIVFNRVGEPNTNQRSHHGQIERIFYEGDSDGGWSPDDWSDPEILVEREDGTNYYYPAYAPDPDYLVLNRSFCDSGNTGSECDQDMDPTAQLLMMRAEPGAEPVELDNANAPGITDDGEYDLYNSFPKWAPFEFQRTEEFGSRLFWVTFSSKRNVGLREPVGDDALLWMAAVDPTRVDGGEDPSFPAFAIPYQEFDTDNHIPQWTESAVVIE